MGNGQSFPKVFTYVLQPDQGGDLTLLRGKLAKVFFPCSSDTSNDKCLFTHQSFLLAQRPWQANTKLKHNVGDFANKGETPAFWAAGHGQVELPV